MFVWFSTWMIVAYATVIFAIRSGKKAKQITFPAEHLRFASHWIFYSFVMTRAWRMALPEWDAGYLVIDIALAFVFTQRWQNGRHSAVLQPLVLIQFAFILIHVTSSVFNFSGHYFGAERSHHWADAFLRNRLFELSWLWILLAAGLKALQLNSKSFNRWVQKALQTFHFSSTKISHLLKPPSFDRLSKMRTTIWGRIRDR